MKSVKKFAKFIVVFTVIFSWIFSGWPEIGNFPPKVREAQAAINQTTYLSSTASAQITSTVSWQIAASAPASSNVLTSCKNAKTTGYCQETPGAANATNAQAKPTAPNGKGWIYDTALDSTIPTGTWTFNMRTTNNSATGTGFMAVCAWKVKVTAGAIISSVNIINCVDGATNLQANTTTLFVSSVSVASVPATSFAPNEFLYVEYWLHTTAAGGSTTGKVIFEANAGASDDIVLPGASTNLAASAPSQDSPANSATGVSTTPTFLMTATDPETDNLSYKATIYSDNLCTTIAQTNDQAVSSTGWTGSNATCTASPTACYLSGTQGSFLTQTALTASTQYWWKASAKNPDGNNTFTDSSTCNTFTTAASQTLTFSLGASSLAFGTLSTTAVSTGWHTITVGTNAANGVVVTYSGATLTSGANTITALSAGGTSAVGTSQYGINAVANTTPTVGANCSGTVPIAAAATGYATADNFKFVSGETIVSSTAAINNTTCTISYIANISGITAAGSYTSTLTYVATGTF